MSATRRSVLKAMIAAAAAGAGMAGCSSGASSSKDTALWYWSGGLSEKVVKAAVGQFGGQTKITPSVIGGDFKQKLTTTLTGGQFVPAITGIKGEDMSYFLSAASKFVDLNSVGAGAKKSEFLPWKWARGTAPGGAQVGYPIDIGPTAMFYRTDLWEKAGLPTDPVAVGTAVSTWDGFYQIGQQLHGKVPTTFPVSSLAAVWSIAIAQGRQRFVDQNNAFLGAGPEIRAAWDTAIKAHTLGLNAKAASSFNAALAQGAIGAEFGPSWHALDIKNGAPTTTGKWKVAAHPGTPTNNGGSFLAIPKQAPDAKLALSVIEWLLSPANQAIGFTTDSLFPSAPAAYALPALTAADPFFGGQKTIEVFGPSAQKVQQQYEAPSDAAVQTPYATELGNVESNGKNPDQAWKDAVAAARQIATRQGVK